MEAGIFISPSAEEKLRHIAELEAAMADRMKAREKYVPDLVSKGVPFVAAIVMAGDMETADVASERVRNGADPKSMVWRVGSYARFDWAVKHLPKADLFQLLPQLWSGSDPDDSDPRYMELWREAFAANGNRIIRDEDDDVELPEAFTIYRGQIGNAEGFAWSRSRKVAQLFADTGNMRTKVAGGKLLQRTVKRSEVLAYITGRNEYEVILNNPLIVSTAVGGVE